MTPYSIGCTFAGLHDYYIPEKLRLLMFSIPLVLISSLKYIPHRAKPLSVSGTQTSVKKTVFVITSRVFCDY